MSTTGLSAGRGRVSGSQGAESSLRARLRCQWMESQTGARGGVVLGQAGRVSVNPGGSRLGCQVLCLLPSSPKLFLPTLQQMGPSFYKWGS